MKAARCGKSWTTGHSDFRAGIMPDSVQPPLPVWSESHLIILEAAAVRSGFPLLRRYRTWLAPQTAFFLLPNIGTSSVSKFNPSCLVKPLIHHGPVMYMAALPVRNSLSESVMPGGDTLYL